MKKYTLFLIAGLMLLVLLTALTACAHENIHPTSSYNTLVPTLAPAESESETSLTGSDPIHGETLYRQWQCHACHGERAQGAIGPRLASTTLEFEPFSMAVRQTRPPKPAFSEDELSVRDVHDIYAWVQTISASEEVAEVQNLPEGEVLGMQFWTASGCDACHGAFAQGEEAAMLAGTSLEWDDFLAATRAAEPADAHAEDLIPDDILSRLHRWLQAGASVGGGC